MTDMVRVKLENGAETSVPSGFADRLQLRRASDGEGEASAVGKNGRILPPTYPEQIEQATAETAKLRGQALNDALTEAGLSVDGSLADRQGRLAEHQAQVLEQQQLAGVGGTPPGGDTDNPGGQSAGAN